MNMGDDPQESTKWVLFQNDRGEGEQGLLFVSVRSPCNTSNTDDHCKLNANFLGHKKVQSLAIVPCS